MPLPKLLITGCNGLVGRILWDHLENDFNLYGLDVSSSKSSEKIFQADISKPEQVQSVFSGISSLTYVVHLAGDPRADAGWDSVFVNNIGGTKNIYEAARIVGVKRIVFASSNHATGAYESFPASHRTKPNPTLITVRDPIRPDGFYGVSKAAGEAIARMYHEVYGLESICLRIGSVTQDDDPRTDPRFKSTWLSHRDLVQLVRKSLTADVKFGIYYGVSNNHKRFWDISNAETELGYHPEDNASKQKHVLNTKDIKSTK
ncbi:MAG: NAD(P)-dependent oxidoreductase [Anaerolineales bacterium]